MTNNDHDHDRLPKGRARMKSTTGGTILLRSCLLIIVLWTASLALGTILVMVTGHYLFPGHYNWSWLQAFVFILTARALVTPLSISAQ